MANQYDDKIPHKKWEIQNPTNINDTEEDNELEEKDLRSVNDDETTSKPNSQTATVEPKKEEITPVVETATATKKADLEELPMSDFEKSMAEVNEILGIAALSGGRDRKAPPAKIPTPAELNAKDTAPKEGEGKTETPATAAPKTSGRVAMGGLAAAGEAVKKDPLVETKKAALEQGRLFGVPIGQAQAEGTATAEVSQQSLAAQLATKGTEKPALSETPVLSTVQAAEHYPSEFQSGYTRGFNQGYATGLQALQIKANADKEKAKTDMKATPAYQAGLLAGTNQATNSCDATKAATEAEKAKYANLPAEGTSTVTPATAFSTGFNAGYGEGLGKKQQAAAAAAEAEKTHPDYVDGEKLAQQAVADPANANKYKAEAEATGKDLTKKAYLVGFNKAYAIKMGADQAAQANLSNPAAVAKGEYKSFFDAGKTAATNGTEAAEKQSLPPVENESEAENKSRQNKAHSAYIMGYNRGLAEKSNAANNPKGADGKPLDKTPIKFRHGVAVGKVIGLLTAQGGEENIAKNENIKKLLEGQKLPTNEGKEGDAVSAAPTLDKLKAYLSGLEFMVGPKKRPELPKEKSIESAQMEPAERQKIIEQQQAFDAMQNLGDEKDFEQGYTRGYNESYAKGLGKKQGDKANTLQNAGKNDPEFKAGFQDGQAVGQLAAETNQKAGTPETKAAFQVELDKVKAQAAAQGEMYSAGFNQGFNAAYATILGGGEIAVKEGLPNSIQAILAAYENVGDSEMVELITKQYESSYEAAYKEIYELLTAPYNPEAKKEEGQKFVTLPTAAELDQKRIAAGTAKQNEIKESYAAEVATYTKQEKAGNTKATTTLAAIENEIKALAFASEKAYELSYAAAENNGYSFIDGFNVQIAVQRGDAAEDKAAYVVPKPAKANGKEVKKGTEAAKTFEMAMRLSKSLTTPDKDGKVYKNSTSMSLPPIVVSTAYKQGYEEANIRWKVVKMVQNGIPVPSKLKNNDIYKALTIGEKEAALEAIVTTPQPEKGEVKPEAQTLDPMARPNPLPQTKGDAETMRKNNLDAVINADIDFFKRKTAIAYLKSLNAVKTARESTPESPQLASLKKCLENLDTAFTDAKTAEKATTPPPDKNKAINDFKAALDALGNFGTKAEKERLQSYQTKVKNKEITVPKADTLATDVTKYITAVKGNITEPNDSSFDKIVIDSNDYQKQLTDLAAISGESKETIEKGINAAEADYEDGYFTAQKLVFVEKVETNADDQDSFAATLASYGEDIGYANGYVKAAAEQGLDKQQQARALRLINQYLQETEANIPMATVEAIKQIQPTYTDVKAFAITCVPETQQFLDDTKEIKILYNKAHDRAQNDGAKDGLAAYNLSTDTFSFTGAKKRADSEMTKNAGPLGAKATEIFSQLLKTVQDFSLPDELKKATDNIGAQITKAKTAAELVRNADVEAFAQIFKTEQETPTDTKEKPKNKAKDNTPEDKKPEAPFAPLLFGTGTFEVGKSLSLPLQKELKFEQSNLKYQLVANDNFVFTSNKTLFMGSEDGAAAEAITLFNGQKTLAFAGSGLFITKDDKQDQIFKPRVIIPSLQKGLIEAKSQLGADFIKSYIEKMSDSTKIFINPESLKKELIAMHNNLMAAINKKEIGDNQAKG
jgi:hypothetical protein